MRKLFAIAFMLFFCAVAASAQTVKSTGGNNYEYTKPAPKTEEQLKANASVTDGFYTHKDGTKYPVFLSKNGKPFVIRKSEKTGNYYRMYLRVEK